MVMLCYGVTQWFYELQAHTKDLVNRAVGRECAVEDAELSLQSLGDVIATTPRVDHGSHDLHVHNGGEVSRFVQAVHTRHLHQLTHNLIGDLKDNAISTLVTVPRMYTFPSNKTVSEDGELI